MASTEPHRVLVVDDYPDTAEVSCMLFRDFGCRATAATTGAEALVAATWFRPDIVVLDIEMPRMNGYELARVLRTRHGRSLYIVAMTGWVTVATPALGFAAGFDSCIVKPAKAKQLRTIIIDAEEHLRCRDRDGN